MADDLQPVKTDDGFEIRDPEGNVIYSTTDSWQYPPDKEAMKEVFEYEDVNTGLCRVLRLMVGIPDVQNERDDRS